MDWSKAKTILIIAFVVTNILLLGVLLSSERQVETTIGEGFIKDVIRLLGEKNISIKGEIPRKIPNLNTVTVEYETINGQEVNRNFFNGRASLDNEGSDTINISYEDEYIRILNKKTLSYENKRDEKVYKNLDEEEAEEILLNFLEVRKYDTSDMELSHMVERDQGYYMEFSKIYNDKYLEDSYTKALVDSRGVAELERTWLKALEEGGTPIFINTAPKAILSLLSMEEAYGKTIVDISLVYYFNPSSHDYLQEMKEARKGKTVPAWRVSFEDGQKIIIDNY